MKQEKIQNVIEDQAAVKEEKEKIEKIDEVATRLEHVRYEMYGVVENQRQTNFNLNEIKTECLTTTSWVNKRIEILEQQLDSIVIQNQELKSIINMKDSSEFIDMINAIRNGYSKVIEDQQKYFETSFAEQEKQIKNWELKFEEAKKNFDKINNKFNLECEWEKA